MAALTVFAVVSLVWYNVLISSLIWACANGPTGSHKPALLLRLAWLMHTTGFYMHLVFISPLFPSLWGGQELGILGKLHRYFSVVSCRSALNQPASWFYQHSKTLYFSAKIIYQRNVEKIHIFECCHITTALTPFLLIRIFYIYIYIRMDYFTWWMNYLLLLLIINTFSINS